jgi:hypothetical protein
MHMVNLSLHIEITASCSPDLSLYRSAKLTELFLLILIAYIAWLLGTLPGGAFYRPQGNTNRLDALPWPAYMAIRKLFPANPG